MTTGPHLPNAAGDDGQSGEDPEGAASAAGNGAHDAPESAQVGPGRLAFKLNRLIEASRPADGRAISSRALAQALTEAGTPVSTSFIAYLRDGRRDNPTYKVVAALAEFFKVPAGYFFDDDEKTAELDSQLELLMALRDGHVKTVLTRMPELQASTRRWLAEQMPALKRMEGSGGEEPPAPDGQPT